MCFGFILEFRWLVIVSLHCISRSRPAGSVFIWTVFDIVSETETVAENLKWYKSPVTEQTETDFIQAGWKTVRSEMYKLNKYVQNKEGLPQEWKKSITVPIYNKEIKQAVISGISVVNYIQNYIKHFSVKINSTLCLRIYLGSSGCILS